MTETDIVWRFGRLIVTSTLHVFGKMRTYGKERVPLFGGAVRALTHFSWVDPPAFGSSSPRTIHSMATTEAHQVPVLGLIIRAFGTFSVRRGESDREAVRMMRQVVRDGNLLGLFVEGTRQRSGVPGKAQPGAAMTAIQENVPVVPGAIHGSQNWRLGSFQPITVVWGEQMRFDGLSKNARGYREASSEIERELHRLWQFAVDLHEAGRPRVAVPPR
jgi:1-acyl-sn-glycerol-3-phosphate acyltransferase